MPFFNTSFLRRLACGLVLSASLATALPPAAPSGVQARVSTGVRSGNTALTGDTFVVTWDDNAIDETGYRVEFRGGNTGSFYNAGYFGPNQEGMYLGGGTASPFNLLPGQTIQFQVTAYKFNGAQVEFRSGPIQTIVYPSATSVLNPPTGLTAAVQGDGRVQLNWVDTSNAETYHQVFYKKQADTTYTKSFYLELDRTNVLLRSGQLPPSKLAHLLTGSLANGRVDFTPGTTYQFRVRSVLRLIQAQNNYHNATPTRVPPYDSELSNEVSVAVPALAAPTNLLGSVLDQTRIRLRWTDNSENESGYRIEYKDPDDTTWERLGSGATATAANATQFDVTVGSAVSLDWRVLAVYLDPVSGNEVSVSAPTNEIELGTTFPGPGNLTATDTGYAGQIRLDWQDQSEAETNFEVFARVKGTPDWKRVITLPADTRRVNVTEAEFTEGSASEFEKGTTHEFRVEAVIYTRNSSGTGTDRLASQQAAMAEATPNEGFVTRWQNLFASVAERDLNGYGEDDVIRRPYHPVRQGVFFSYQLATSNPEARTGWSVTGLPAGLAFNAATGVISGTPILAGLFPCTLTAQFNNGHTATAVLNLRVLPQGATPSVVTPIPSVTYAPGLQLALPLQDRFADADSEVAVRLRTTLGDLDLLLYPELTPESVQNFLHYVNRGTYNGVAFHRSVPGFILQTGSYVPVQAPDFFVLNQPSRTPPRNEPGISNLRGTVAWAKLPGSPDSATLDFFVNLSDNSLNLDNQNEGFSAFGRVAGNGMTVADAIAALPIGVYRNFNTGTGTTASLDKRVQLFELSNGQYQFLRREALETVPMNSTGSAPVDMDVERTVRIQQAEQIPVFRYSITANSNSSVVTAAISGTSLVLQTLQEGSSQITVQAADLDGNVSSQTFTATVERNFRAPVITRQPVSVTVTEGAGARLTVQATGSGILAYQWLRNGVELDGRVEPTLALEGVDASQTGQYAVRVSNAGFAVLSNIVRVDLRAPPVFTEQPQSKVVEVGQPLQLNVDGTGAPLPAIAWLRSGRVVPGQSSIQLQLPAVTLGDGGVYQARASNAAAKNVLSQPSEVLVVDKASRLAVGLSGQKLVLAAQATGGPGLSYRWFKNHQMLLVDTAAFTGVDKPQLSLNALSPDELGSYTCRVSSANAVLQAETGAWRVHLAVRPVLANFTPDPAYIGLDYDHTLPFGGDANTSVTAFAVKGLPAGLRMDPATGRIQGRPTRPGFYPLTVTGRNIAGVSLPVSGTLVVLPMPEPAVGAFIGQVAASAVLNGNKGGRFDMTVTDSGQVSGKLVEGKNSYSFTGTMRQTPGSNFATGQATIVRRGQSTLNLLFQTVALQGFTDSGDISGLVSDGVNTAEIYGYRRVFHPSWNPVGLQQTFNMGLHLDEDDVGEADIPQGTGFLRASLVSSGAVTCAGRMGDGASFTCSSFLGSQFQFLVYQSLYNGTGFVGGVQNILGVNLAPAGVNELWLRVSGSVNWQKDAQASAKERAYRDGFGPLSLDSLGISYNPPAAAKPVLGLPQGSDLNASLAFSGGGLGSAQTDPDVPQLTLNGTNVPVIPAAGNPGAVNLAVIRATGQISGGFSLQDDPELKPQRKAAFNGLIIPRIPDTQTQRRNEFGELVTVDVPGDTGKGVGSFLLAQKPSAGPPATTLLTSPMLAGDLRLSSAPIQILAHPASITVNPGDGHTFSVTAQALGELTYQWRFNGVSISGAVAATYQLSAISETNQGQYDVVVSTPYGRIVSTAATLTVNDPVSSVIISRTPAEGQLAEGETVTFTAAAVGSGTLSYQWLRNGQEIADATASTYVIQSLTAADAGNYTVRVVSSLSPTGVVSNQLTLQVASMVTSALAVRLPATEEVAVGSSVTFSVTHDGSGPFTYQWFKNAGEIDGATQASYNIPFVNAADQGDYSVRVGNARTAGGFFSNVVALVIDARVSSVSASRTPSTAAVTVGTRVDFTVGNAGVGPFTYQWYKNGVAIEGATGVNYSITSAVASDTADYTVRVTNEATPGGVLSAPVPLAVGEPVSGVTVSIQLPVEQPVDEGENVLFVSSAQGTAPLIYQWYFNDQPIEGATSATLSISAVTLGDAGNYTLRVSNAFSPEAVASNAVSLEVRPP